MNYYCPYCQERCHKNAWDSEWLYCKTCNIKYRDWRPDCIIFSVNLENRKYEVYKDVKETKVVELLDGDYLPYDEKVVLRLDYPIPSLNPDNVAQKLKTLLVFS
jgi:hypothetical protein